MDAILVAEIGEIGFHTLRDLHVEIYRLRGDNLREVLENFSAGRLERLDAPTHSSEEKIPGGGS